jgi:hypothetical protein
MKRKASIFGLVLLLIWILPVALNVPLVQADAGGTGKFLTIEIVGEGYIGATKVQSGETWEFYWTDPPMTEKVGAGTVTLEAFASPGWEFSHWKGDLAGSESPTDYKTQKYGYVMAVFVRRTYTITASATGNGTIEPEGEVLVEHGADQTFNFAPDPGNHVSRIFTDVDGYLRSFALNYTFYNVTADHIISVSFSADGTAIVDAGYDVYAFLAAGATLGFDETEGGVATGESVDYPVGTYAVIWDVNVSFAFVGEGLVCLEYDDTGLSEAEESNLRLIHAESKWAFLSDVNQDLRVDGTDVSIIANAVKQGQWYDPWLDINNDGFVNEEDVHIVNDNKGAYLEDITLEVNTDLNLICGRTDSFSIFGARKGTGAR